MASAGSDGASSQWWLTLCASCKSVRRSSQEGWLALEAFLHEHLSVRVTHGICPRCMQEGFPNSAAKMLDAGKEERPGAEQRPRRQGMEGIGDRLSLCARCKSVQDPDGEWAALDVSLRHRLNTRVIYGICPHCAAARQA